MIGRLIQHKKSWWCHHKFAQSQSCLHQSNSRVNNLQTHYDSPSNLEPIDLLHERSKLTFSPPLRNSTFRWTISDLKLQRPKRLLMSFNLQSSAASSTVWRTVFPKSNASACHPSSWNKLTKRICCWVQPKIMKLTSRNIKRFQTVILLQVLSKKRRCQYIAWKLLPEWLKKFANQQSKSRYWSTCKKSCNEAYHTKDVSSSMQLAWGWYKPGSAQSSWESHDTLQAKLPLMWAPLLPLLFATECFCHIHWAL